MNNLTIIGFVGGNAEVIDLKKQDGSTVTTFSVATKEVRGTGEARKEYTTWHKVAVYGGLQKFAATIKKGDRVWSEYSTYRFLLGRFRIERSLRTKAGLCWQHYEHAPGAFAPNSAC